MRLAARRRRFSTTQWPFETSGQSARFSTSPSAADKGSEAGTGNRLAANSFITTAQISHWCKAMLRFGRPVVDPNKMLRVCYDAVLSYLCLGLAFGARTIVYSIWEPDLLVNGVVVQSLQNHFINLGYLLPITTVIIFACCGLYQKTRSQYSSWRPAHVIAVVSIAVITFYVVSIFISPKPLLPRGVIVFTWFFMIFFLAMPRIIKFFMFRKVVFEAGFGTSARPQNVLVIGGAGYVGAPLVEDLLSRGYQVRILDSLLFGNSSVQELVDRFPKCELLVGDFRNIETLITAMKDMDAVVHLGGIVGDPACSLDDDFTIDVNLTATALLVETCKLFRIRRLVFASSCSVYGQAESECLTEESSVHPVSLYARTKVAAERVLLEQTTDSFQPTILRLATLFGLSLRPRFDLVVNLLTAQAVNNKKICVFGGTQWRPFVHVKDAAKTIRAVLEAPLSKVGGQILNVGSPGMNYQILDVGNKVTQIVEGTTLIVDKTTDDIRNYIVSFDKLQETLGIELDRDLEFGIEEIKAAYLEGKLKPFDSPEYSNVVQTEKVLACYVNHLNDDIHANVKTHHKKTSKTLLQEL